MSKSIGLALEIVYITSNSIVNILLSSDTDIVATMTTMRVLDHSHRVGHDHDSRTIKRLYKADPTRPPSTQHCQHK